MINQLVADKEKHPLYACGCCCFWVLFVLLFVFPFVFFTSKDTERAVLYSKLFARFDDQIVENGGFHSKPYNAQVIRWSRIEETVTYNKLECNSGDGLIISMQVSFQVFPDPGRLLDLTKEFRDYGRWKDIMVTQAESAIRNVCGDFVADQFQTSRGAIAAAMEAEVKNATATKFSAVVTKLQLREVQRPTAYENAVRNKENARSEIRLAENERQQALTKAETKVDVANQEAVRLINTAETQAQVKLNQAIAQAEAIEDRFTRLGEVYASVKSSLALDIPGILTYIANEVFVTGVTLAVDSPVALSFKDEL